MDKFYSADKIGAFLILFGQQTLIQPDPSVFMSILLQTGLLYYSLTENQPHQYMVVVVIIIIVIIIIIIILDLSSACSFKFRGVSSV